ncbi:hypothetical protein D8674_024560 [Pyrus ussuriensis x Pyrus communis]|uniref:Uncharacterized protein n=1 Tax=Pyrus ussuriensis x Pyrus communis TaxID=2448454 RepID=A0A5N5H487_9ROSA|nr:hypothetical protein D8674_024560 [Pyrus ussuriensis x Pyrus communis]
MHAFTFLFPVSGKRRRTNSDEFEVHSPPNPAAGHLDSGGVFRARAVESEVDSTSLPPKMCMGKFLAFSMF